MLSLREEIENPKTEEMSQGHPIAYLHDKSGRLEGQQVYLHNIKSKIEEDDVRDAVEHLFQKKPSFRDLTAKDENLLVELILKRSKIPSRLQPMYEDTIAFINKRRGKSLIFGDDVSTIPLVNPDPKDNQNKRYLIGGVSGCGKSSKINLLLRAFIAASWAECRWRPKIFVFSALGEDENLEHGIPPEMIKKITPDMIMELIQNKEPLFVPEDFKGKDFCRMNFCVFDDIQAITNPFVAKYVQKLQDDILQAGRHYFLHIACVSHDIQNFGKTKAAIKLSSDYIFFPNEGNREAVSQFLKEKMRWKDPAIQKFIDVEGRGTVLCKTNPPFVLGEREIYLLE